jgi:hypothetical protein
MWQSVPVAITDNQDSDSIPLADPEALFNAPSYKRLGIWATPDYWKTPSNNPMWAIMGVKCRNEWEMESGQMVVDKKRHMDVMLLVRYMMERHDFVCTSLFSPVAVVLTASGSGSLTETKIYFDSPYLPYVNDGVSQAAGFPLPVSHVELNLVISARIQCCNMTPMENRCLSITTSSSKFPLELEKDSPGDE